MHVYLYKTNSGHHLPPLPPTRQSPSTAAAASRNCASSSERNYNSELSIVRMSASTDRDQQARGSSSSVPAAADHRSPMDYRNDPIVFNRYYSQNDLDTFPRQQGERGDDDRSTSRDHYGSAAVSIAADVVTMAPSPLNSSTLSRCRHTNWEACEEQRLRELEEAKTRASQMEKTMKWWSACTANWREKWSRVRDERNRYRNDIGEIRAKLETIQAELIQAQLEKRELLKERKQAQSIIDNLNKEFAVASNNKKMDEVGDRGWNIPASKDFSCQCYIPERASTLYTSVYGTPTTQAFCRHRDIGTTTTDEISGKPSSAANSVDRLDEITERNLHTLKNRMEDTMRLLMEEREERSKMNKKFFEMESEMKMTRAKCDELEASKQASVEELEELKSVHSEALQKLKRVRTSPNSFDQQLYSNVFKVDTPDNDDSMTSSSRVYQSSAPDQRKEELTSLKKLLDTEDRLDEAIELEKRLRSDNNHLHEQIDELQTSLQAIKDEGNQWKDECGALRKANDELMSRLGSLEISIISSIEGSDMEKDPCGE